MSRIFERQLEQYQQSNEAIIIKDYFERLEGFKTLGDFNNYKDLGFKKYSLNSNDKVFGLDFNIRSAERLIATFLHDHKSSDVQTLNKIFSDDELTIILHRIAEHDKQSYEAKQVGQLGNDFDINVYAERDRSIEHALALKEVYSQIQGSKIVRLLTEDKNEIVSEFVNLKNSPMILEGIAGSGKTEVLKSILDIWHQNNPNDKILFITASQNLVTEIKKNLNINSQNVQFHTLSSLLNNLSNQHKTPLNQANLSELLKSGLITNYAMLTSVLNVIEKFGLMRVYAEIVGIILGKLNKQHVQLSLNDYINFNGPESITSDKQTRDNLFKLAQIFSSFKSNQFFESNTTCNDLMNNISLQDKFDLVLIDEVQDFTEVQFHFVFNLSKVNHNLFITGDTNQTINPTLFNIGQVMSQYSDKSINWHLRGPLGSNFRNSSEVTQFINVLNELRIEKLTARKQKYSQNEIGNNPLSGKIYLYKGNINDLDKLRNQSNVIEVSSDIKKDNSRITVHDVKGLEYENLIIENLVSDYSKLIDKIFDDNYIKTESMHYFFNLFYVAVSRSLKNIILVEEKNSKFIKYIENKLLELKIVKVVSNVNEIDIDTDESIDVIFENGVVHLEKDAYMIAHRNFEIVQRVNPYYPQIRAYSDLINKLISNQPHSVIAEFCESNGLYELAAKFYQRANLKSKYCLMALLNNDNDLFKLRLIEMNIDAIDIAYSNEILDWHRKLIGYHLNDQLTQISILSDKLEKTLSEFQEV